MPGQDENTDEKNEQGNEASDQGGDTDKKNEQEQNTNSDSGNEAETGDDASDEGVTLTKEEHEALIKKGSDFDAIIEGRRAAKLASGKKKDKKPTSKTDESSGADADDNDDDKLTADKVAEIAAKAATDAVRQSREPEYKANLGDALKAFIKDHPWANSDIVIENITEKFEPGDAFTSETLRVRLNRAAEETYPEQYDKANVDRYRNRAAADTQTSEDGSTGEGGSGAVPGSSSGEALPSKITKDDREAANRFFNGDMKKYFKHKDKD